MGNRVSVDPDEGIIKATRTIRKSGNSIVVVIPPQLIEGAGFEIGDDVELAADMTNGGITIRAIDPAAVDE